MQAITENEHKTRKILYLSWLQMEHFDDFVLGCIYLIYHVVACFSICIHTNKFCGSIFIKEKWLYGGSDPIWKTWVRSRFISLISFIINVALTHLMTVICFTSSLQFSCIALSIHIKLFIFCSYNNEEWQSPNRSKIIKKTVNWQNSRCMFHTISLDHISWK